MLAKATLGLGTIPWLENQAYVAFCRSDETPQGLLEQNVVGIVISCQQI